MASNTGLRLHRLAAHDQSDTTEVRAVKFDPHQPSHIGMCTGSGTFVHLPLADGTSAAAARYGMFLGATPFPRTSQQSPPQNPAQKRMSVPWLDFEFTHARNEIIVLPWQSTQVLVARLPATGAEAPWDTSDSQGSIGSRNSPPRGQGTSVVELCDHPARVRCMATRPQRGARDAAARGVGGFETGTLATGCDDGVLRLWRLRARQPAQRSVLPPGSASASAAVAATLTDEWEVATELLRTRHEPLHTAAAAGGAAYRGSLDSPLCVAVEAHTAPITALAHVEYRDGTLGVASAGLDGNVCVSNVSNGDILLQIASERVMVHALVFVPDVRDDGDGGGEGGLLAATTDQGSLSMWRVATGMPVMDAHHSERAIRTAAVSRAPTSSSSSSSLPQSSGRVLCTGADDGCVRLYAEASAGTESDVPWTLTAECAVSASHISACCFDAADDVDADTDKARDEQQRLLCCDSHGTYKYWHVSQLPRQPPALAADESDVEPDVEPNVLSNAETDTVSQPQLQPQPQPTSTKKYAMHTAAGVELQAAAEQMRYSVQQLLAMNPASASASQVPQQSDILIPPEPRPQLQPTQPHPPSQAQIAHAELIGGEELTPLPRSGDAPPRPSPTPSHPLGIRLGTTAARRPLHAPRPHATITKKEVAKAAAATVGDATRRGTGYPRKPVPESWDVTPPLTGAEPETSSLTGPARDTSGGDDADDENAATELSIEDDSAVKEDNAAVITAGEDSEFASPALQSTQRLHRRLEAVKKTSFDSSRVEVQQATIDRANSALNFARHERIYDDSTLRSVDAPTPTRPRVVRKQVRKKWLREQALKPDINAFMDDPRLKPVVDWADQEHPTLVDWADLEALPPQTSPDHDLDLSPEFGLMGITDWCSSTY